MDKLQLYISRSSASGFKSVRNFNPHEYVQSRLPDPREAMEAIDYDEQEKYLFYMLSYTDGGSFFTILRTIPHRAPDHLACSIFVPDGIVVTRDEMAEIVRRTTRIISNSSVSDEDIYDLHQLFSAEYPVEPDAPATDTSDPAAGYAVWLYGGETGNTLEELLGQHIYQPDFAQYAAVLLIDAELGVYTRCTDVSDIKPVRTVALYPPEPSDSGFMPYIYGKIFDKPYLVPLGRDTEIVWRRNGYDDRTQTVRVERDGQQPAPITTADSLRTLSLGSFKITAHGSNKPIDNADISVNGISLAEPREFMLKDLQSAEVSIQAPGFATYNGTMNLAAQSTALIKLHSSRKIYRFALPVKSSELGAPIHFEIHTKRELVDSPIEGYSLLDNIREGKANTNHLAFNEPRRTSWRPYALGAAAGLLLGLLIGWIMPGGSSTDTDTAIDPDSVATTEATPGCTRSDKAAATTADTHTATAQVSSGAISYLDNNKSWSKAQLDKYPELKGLFDDMNNFRLNSIVDKWGPRLAGSKRFGLVAQHARESLNKKIFKPQGTYCSAGDYTISVQSYLNRIDPSAKKTDKK